MLITKIYKTKFQIEEDNTKLQIAKWLLNDRQGNFHKLWKFWEISSEQIEENQGQSQIIAGERLPLWSLSLTTKIILIFATRKDSPNFVHCLLMAFSDLQKQNITIFWKNITLARANVKLKPYGATLRELTGTSKWNHSANMFFGSHFLFAWWCIEIVRSGYITLH